MVVRLRYPYVKLRDNCPCATCRGEKKSESGKNRRTFSVFDGGRNGASDDYGVCDLWEITHTTSLFLTDIARAVYNRVVAKRWESQSQRSSVVLFSSSRISFSMSHFVRSFADWSAQSDPVDELLMAGWCETVSLPGLGIEAVVAKLDTGAVVSSLHATQIEYFTKRRTEWVRFRTIDMGAHTNSVVRCESRLLSKRSIRSSNGSVELRPVVETSFIWVALNGRLSFLSTIDRSSNARYFLGVQRCNPDA